MEVDTGEELPPILVADLAAEEALLTLRKVAARKGTIVVPLLAAPVDRRKHLLEVYVDGLVEPAVFLAEPVGAPTSAGFPLRLEPHGPQPDEPAPPAPRGPHSEPPTMIKTVRGNTSPSISERHTRDLEFGSKPAEPEPAPYLGRSLGAGKYRLDALIGKGGMGAVYRAFHRDLDKDVAVKVLHPSFLADPTFSKRFHAEALTMSKIDHPNVTRILDFGQEEDGVLYLVMEFLDGKDLQSVIDQEGQLPLERIVRIGMGVSSALGHVHRHGIIHRDVKPSNIILVAGLDEEDETPTEVPKVCDFGIAHPAGSDGRVAGTPEYMSPEQCRGLELDARSDVYACGVLLYELATGQLPFTGSDPAATAKMQVMNAPPRPSTHVPDLDPLFEELVMKALAKDPTQRQASMRHLRAELRELLSPVVLTPGDSGEHAPASLVPASEESTRKEPVPSASATASGDDGSWIEGRSEGMSQFFTSLADTVTHHSHYHAAEELADTLAADPQPWLRDLSSIHDPVRFETEVALLERPVRRYMKKADANTLAAIVGALRAILKEDGAIGARAKDAGKILRLLRDPPALAPLVDAALGATEEPSAALQRVLIEPQAAAAEALLEGRARHASASARVRFGLLVRAIGPAAAPVLTPALRACLERGERSGAFVEDLLRAIPPGPNEAAGTVVAEFLRGGSPVVAGAALVALGGLWGERARPLLHGALGSADHGIVTAAISGLRVLRAIDAHVLRRLEPIVTGAVDAPEELCVAAASALADVTPEARLDAATLAARAFSTSRVAGSIWTSPRPPPTSYPSVAVALGRALIALRVPNATSMIHDRAASCPEAMRRALVSLLPPKP